MSLLYVLGFGLKAGHLFWTLCCWILSLVSLNSFITGGIEPSHSGDLIGDAVKLWEKMSGSSSKIQHHHHNYYQHIGSKLVRKPWYGKLMASWVVGWSMICICLFLFMNNLAVEFRKGALASMCDERARMLQDQFNVSMNHVQAMSILISTFHHGKSPSAIDQKTFAKYTERTAFERPLTSGVAYAVRVLHPEREKFEKQQGWTIRRMDTVEQNPVQEEYAPVIFAQDTVAHVVSLDVLSGKEDRDNVLRARESGKGVLTAPFRLLKTNRLGVILTFAVYKRDLPPNATPQERIQATDGYLGGIFDIESLVKKLLKQLASEHAILVNVYDTTNHSHPISMYGSNVSLDRLEHVSSLNFGDPFRSHEMRCRFKQKAPLPMAAILASNGLLLISLLIGFSVHETMKRFATVEDECNEMKKLKKLAEAADVAKSEFLATVSHEIRTPMNGVLGMLDMLIDTDLDVTQQDYVRTAQGSGKALVSLINEVLDQAKIESGKLDLEAVRFDLRQILDDVLSLFSGKSQEKGVELAVYISDRVPDMLIGDPGRFRQIITNLMGNSVKVSVKISSVLLLMSIFTEKGHIMVTVHLVEEVMDSIDIETEASSRNTLSGFPVADKRLSWAEFRSFNKDTSNSSPDLINLIVSVEDTGEGIPQEDQSRVFTPFVQVGPSISRKQGGTGIGLSISKCLVNLMNGEIGFVSIPKIGSTFSFTAVFTNDLKSQKLDQSNKTMFSPEFQGMRALVVDSRPVRAKMSRYHVQRLGIQVELIPTLSQALSGITTGNIVASMVLVEQDVWDADSTTSSLFVNSLRKLENQASPKLFVLANSVTSLRTGTITSGLYAPSIIVKPLRSSMLAASLQRAMGVGNKGNPRNGELLPKLSLLSLLAGRKILIVDDNFVNLKVATGALKKYGADVVSAESGQKAISFLEPPHTFDACFMDIQMPEMDGFEATRRIREMEINLNDRIQNGDVSVESCRNISKWHVPILAMTADVIQATHEECTKCGMDGYVSKPFEAQQLYQEVSRFFTS
ncbi:Histidine kinase 3 [Linum perenne]